MQRPTLRGYVWGFCLYFALLINQLSHHTAIRAPYIDRSFFTFFASVIGPGWCIFLFISVLPKFRNSLMRAVLILSAFGFAFSIVFALYQYEYISFGIPHWFSGCSWFIATVLLGYRTDQLLKEQNQEIEAN